MTVAAAGCATAVCGGAGAGTGVSPAGKNLEAGLEAAAKAMVAAAAGCAAAVCGGGGAGVSLAGLAGVAAGGAVGGARDSTPTPWTGSAPPPGFAGESAALWRL